MEDKKNGSPPILYLMTIIYW